MPTTILTVKILYRFIFLSCFIFACINISGQKLNSDCNLTGNDSALFDENLTGDMLVSYTTLKGQNFMNKDWRVGEVILENNKRIKTYYFNYHLFVGQLIWLRPSDYQKVVVAKETVKEFIIYSEDAKSKDLFRKMKIRPRYMIDSAIIYLNVLSQGQLNLYACRKSTINNVTNKFYPVNEYYIQTGSGPLISFMPTRWTLFKVMGEHEKPMKKIVRSNHLRIRREKDLIKAVDLYNQEAIKEPSLY